MAKRGPKRVEMVPGEREHVAVMVARGATVEEVAAALKCGTSTAHRRMREVKAGALAGAQAARRGAVGRPKLSAPVDLDEDDEPPEIDPSTTLEQIGRWLRKVERLASEAEDAGDPDALLKYTRLVVFLLGEQRKMQPPPPVDPNANPDFIEAAKRVRALWEKTLEGVAKQFGFKP